MASAGTTGPHCPCAGVNLNAIASTATSNACLADPFFQPVWSLSLSFVPTARW